MAVNDAGLVIAATALSNAITHAQAHSGAPGAAGTTNVVGSRVAVTGKSVDADGDITFTAAFTGLPANGPVPFITYWSASTAGTLYGQLANGSGDANANAAGALTFTAVENFTAS